ncbi:MAG: nitronate monooxygenase [candidate division KSB1 bacterium]|nr:nitronate monooxygenase [candidate division KSB1 bacterium]
MYAAVERLNEVPGIAAYELNYSCPNVKEGGLSFSSDPIVAERLTRCVVEQTRRPVIAKLTPNVTHIHEIGLAVQSGGADAVSAVNTFLGMAVNIKTKRPKLNRVIGGYSGPAIKPMALAKVYELVQHLSIPVIAIGGISSAQDALEFLITGASAVQIGTANFAEPDITIKIKKGLIDYCENQNVNAIADIIGSLQT